MNIHSGQMWYWKTALSAIAATGVLTATAALLEMRSVADGIQGPREPVHERPTPGTPFWFEVIESFNAKYQGDTAGHIGRGGGLSLQPHVALGDSVHHRVGDADIVVGSVTGLTWERLRGSLTVEFRSHEGHRIAVGDEVWVDLNPADQKPPATTAGSPASEAIK